MVLELNLIVIILVALLESAYLFNYKGMRSYFDDILFLAFDYRDVYIVKSKGSNKYKIGISRDSKRRIAEIDKSIEKSKEVLLVHYRFFFSGQVERRMREIFKRGNFTWKGSGKTEWHRMNKIQVIKARAILAKLRIQQLLLVWFSLGSTIIIIILKLL